MLPCAWLVMTVIQAMGGVVHVVGALEVTESICVLPSLSLCAILRLLHEQDDE